MKTRAIARTLKGRRIAFSYGGAFIMTQEEYGQAYQQGFRGTVRLLVFRGASTPVAEDAAQAAWLQGWRKLDQLRDPATITGWINTIAINLQNREGKREARYQALFDTHSRPAIDSSAIDSAKVLNLCRPSDRSLFEQQMRGLTNTEIAESEGVSPTAIRLRFLRARRDVRASLEDWAYQKRESSREDTCDTIAA